MSVQDSIQRLPVATLKQLPIYKKALNLYMLSRKLLENNSTQSLRQLYNSSLEQERLMEDMVVLSLKLPFHVAMAQTSSNYSAKEASRKNMIQNTILLKKHCKQLKVYNTSNHNLLSAFYKELLDFKKMQKQWNVVLRQQN